MFMYMKKYHMPLEKKVSSCSICPFHIFPKGHRRCVSRM